MRFININLQSTSRSLMIAKFTIIGPHRLNWDTIAPGEEQKCNNKLGNR